MFADPQELLDSWQAFLPVVRCKAGEEWQVWPCCSSPVAVKVHWFRRRTVPCVAAVGTCPACVTPSRPLVFLGCALGRPGPNAMQWTPPRVLEVPVSAWAEIKCQMGKFASLAAMRFRVFRHGGRRGRVFVDQFEHTEPIDGLSVREIVAALCRLWSVPAPRVGELDSEWLTRVGVSVSCDGHYSPSSKG